MNKEKEKVSLTVLIVAIIAAWIIITVIIWFVFKDWDKSGTFGDTFGAINSLFSGLALAGIIYTIYLQKTELSLQRKELEYTREELKRTADAQESSSKMMTEQLRLNNIPLIDYHLETILDEGFTIKIFNQSNNPAYDLDIWLLMPIDQKDKRFKDFIEESTINVDDDVQINIQKRIIDDTTWCVRDRGTYNYLSKDKAISIDMPRYLSLNPRIIYVFIQFRDVLGNNYYKLTTLMRVRNNITPYFEYKSLPITPATIDRFDLKNNSKTNLFPLLNRLYEVSIEAKNIKGMKVRLIEKKWDLVPFG
jgi:hypothetical protein